MYRHNEDGSYTYGYEGSDGSFKIETKTRTGEVTGKYGYVDDLGKLRVVEYGANRYGFQPAGEGITVPSPTLVEQREGDDGGDEEPEQAEQPRPSERPRKPVPRPYDHGGAFVPQPSPPRQPQPTTANNARTSAAADFDDYDSAGWTAQSAVPPKPAARPRPAAAPARFGGSAAAVRAKSPPPPPPVAGSFRAAPEEAPQQQQGPSGSYQTVQDFGGSARTASRSDAVDRTYQTAEDQQEPLTEPPALFQAAVAKPARRNGGGGGGSARTAAQSLSAGSYRSAPRQMRTSGILDQLAEQYALPESGSPVSHSVSFGSDQ